MLIIQALAEGSWTVSFVHPSQMTNQHRAREGLPLDQLEFHDVVPANGSNQQWHGV